MVLKMCLQHWEYILEAEVFPGMGEALILVSSPRNDVGDKEEEKGDGHGSGDDDRTMWCELYYGDFVCVCVGVNMCTLVCIG